MHCSSIPRELYSQCAVAHQRQRVHRAIPAFCCVNREALLANPCVSWGPLTLCTLFFCASGVYPLTTTHHSLLSLPVSTFLRVSTRETLGVAT